MTPKFLILLLVICFQSWNVSAFFFPSSNPNAPKVDDATIATTSSITLTTGVPPDLIEKYSKNSFVCDNGQRILTSKEINDDYCDCNDGTDEPGTNACASLGSTFYCENKGYKPITLLSSRVNDGICDCCDGSDETIGERITCYNTCNFMANKEKDMLKGLQTIFNKGYEIRNQLIQKMKSKLETESSDLQSILHEIDNQSALLNDLETQLQDEQQQFKAQEIERDKNVIANLIHLTGIDLIATEQLPYLLKVFMDVVHATDAEIRTILAAGSDGDVDNDSNTEANDSVNNEEEDDNDHIHDDGYDEYGNDEEQQQQRQQEKKSTESTKNKRVSSSSLPFRNCVLHNVATISVEGEENNVDSRFKFICDHVPELDSTTVTATPEVLHTSLYEISQAIIFNLLQSKRSYLQAQWIFGYYRAHGHFNNAYHFTTTLMNDISAANNDNTHTCPSILSSTTTGSSTGSQSLQQQQQQTCEMAAGLKEVIEVHDSFLKSQISAYTPRIEHLKSSLIELKNRRQLGEIAASQLKSYENSLAFLALQNECVSVKDNHFTYKVCFLEKVTQHDDGGGHGEVLLGTFHGQIKEMLSGMTSHTGSSGMSGDSTLGGGGNKYAHMMKFKDGQHCHAFGARSAEVHVTCGNENKLLSAIEPSTCHYVLEMESPAACSERYARENGLSVIGSN